MNGMVAPYARAWIEIVKILEEISSTWVAPYAGAWIEILQTKFQKATAE